jgi:hypothetical protein
MKDFHHSKRQHAKMLFIAMVAISIIGLLSSCSTARHTSCPQAYGYKNYNNNSKFFQHY